MSLTLMVRNWLKRNLKVNYPRRINYEVHKMKLLIRDVCLFDNVKLFLHGVKTYNTRIVNMQQINVSLSIIQNETETNYQINMLFYEIKANYFVFKNDGIWLKSHNEEFPWINWTKIVNNLQPCHLFVNPLGCLLISILKPKSISENKSESK